MISASELSVVWRKSSYSTNGGDCLEVGGTISASELPVSWHKSSYSSSNGGECLEVGNGLTDIVPVRDSKAPHGPAVLFTAATWASFVAEVKGV
ncbi:DUF397 domain-containing protein [Streptomyces turgidiscabies]|uniref:Putative toxin-antitoxin system, toxin component n=1 Tax=Streptomyces turgidiscabies (strain Car8) TaxID=698760 RepID=L7EWL7_STRT8|nr:MULTISPECIES: DUF397 domain-containing protein [Streptomyces]ELP63432.1 putative toxin-antitoxin system, toxin component [Streptomyces turgidiscabies Car8]MDX3497820.1 DUF397 domain-containing protein [Streptomyces turgidiscabies]GAQ69724.1 hypothetical protein T45_01455 [Streptomyces turgidiscabies]